MIWNLCQQKVTDKTPLISAKQSLIGMIAWFAPLWIIRIYLNKQQIYLNLWETLLNKFAFQEMFAID